MSDEVKCCGACADKIRELEIDVLGHEYAMELVEKKLGISHSGNYSAICDQYDAIYNRCQASEIIERELINENKSLRDELDRIKAGQ